VKFRDLDQARGAVGTPDERNASLADEIAQNKRPPIAIGAILASATRHSKAPPARSRPR
jgi:hypothetical protein